MNIETLKFRSWDTVEKRIVFFTLEELLEFQYKMGTGFVGVRNNPSNRMYDKIMQYTGLKDKSGKEIYTGDIIKATEREQQTKDGYERIEQVYWHNGGPKLFSKAMNDFSTEDDMQTIRWCMWRTRGAMDRDIYLELVDFEVIGNIYENPELLSTK